MTPPLDCSLIIEPTVLGDVGAFPALYQKEALGPVAYLTSFSSEEVLTILLFENPVRFFGVNFDHPCQQGSRHG
jgi:hypothetical protein